jgi:hypothetical protein
MAQIRDWGKKVVIILNKTDLLQDETELNQVLDFVRENAHLLLGSTPEIFPVSSRQAQQAKNGEPQLWQPSGFEALENYIRENLDQAEQIKLKFLNPLGVGAHLTGRYYQRAENQRRVWQRMSACCKTSSGSRQFTKRICIRISPFAWRMSRISFCNRTTRR